MNERSIIVRQTTKRNPKSRRAKKPPTQRRKRKTTNRRRNTPTRQSFGLSACADMYLRALTNPFDPRITDACVPDLIDLPSFKLKVMARTTFYVGTLGVGFLSVNPRGAAINDVNAFCATLATYADNVIQNAGATIATGVFSQAPYASAEFGVNSKKFRIVGFGLRVRYIGTELDRGGRLIVFRAPYMTFDATGLGSSDLLGYRTTITRACNRNWHSVAWLPGSSVDYDLSTGASSADVSAPLIIFVEGSTTGNAFEVEMVAHIEYFGSISGVSRSHTDLTGMSAIKDAVNRESILSEPGESWFQSSLSWISNHALIESSGPMVGRLIEGGLKKAVGL